MSRGRSDDFNEPWGVPPNEVPEAMRPKEQARRNREQVRALLTEERRLFLEAGYSEQEIDAMQECVVSQLVEAEVKDA